MAHALSYPEALQTLLTRLPELKLIFGQSAIPGLDAIQRLLREAVAARSAGDIPRATGRIAAAMDSLSQLADSLDPQEAAQMRFVTAWFREALMRGEESEATRASDVMREKSGTTLKKRA